MKALEVTQRGAINAVFIVKDPKKIKFWKRLAGAGGGLSVTKTVKNITIPDKK